MSSRIIPIIVLYSEEFNNSSLYVDNLTEDNQAS